MAMKTLLATLLMFILVACLGSCSDSNLPLYQEDFVLCGPPDAEVVRLTQALASLDLRAYEDKAAQERIDPHLRIVFFGKKNSDPWVMLYLYDGSHGNFQIYRVGGQSLAQVTAVRKAIESFVESAKRCSSRPADSI